MTTTEAAMAAAKRRTTADKQRHAGDIHAADLIARLTNGA